MKKALVLFGIIISLCLVLTGPALAQMPILIGPGDGDNNTTPIGGMAVLAVLGGGYAIKKLYDNSNEHE